MIQPQKFTKHDKDELSRIVGYRPIKVSYPNSIDEIDKLNDVELVRLFRNIAPPGSKDEVVILKYIMSILKQKGWFDGEIK